MRVEPIPVASIAIPARRKRSRRDVTALARSIKREGLLQPIVVDETWTLISGLHRLEAHRMLGLWEIFAHVRTFGEIEAELAEVSENLERNELSALERAEHVEMRERYLQALGRRKPAHRPPKAGDGKGANFAPLPGGAEGGGGAHEALGNEEMAAAMGMSRRALLYDKQIARSIPRPVRKAIKERLPALADNQRELYRLGRLPLIDQVRAVSIIAGGEAKTVADSMRSLERARTRQLAAELPGLDARGADDAPLARTIVVDPPWRGEETGDDNPFGKLRPAYATMPYEDLAALPVGERAEPEDCHLYVWVTNRTFRQGLDLIEAWGFRYIKKLVWVKHRIGTGRYYRNQHEDVLFAVRGTRLLMENDQADVFYGERRRHSQKPEEFYRIVERCSPEPRLELFARGERPGWRSWGAEAAAVAAGVGGEEDGAERAESSG